MTTPRNRYSKLAVGLAGLLLVALFTALAGQLWAYANSGASRQEALHLTTAMLDTHTPRVEWLSDDPETARPMEADTRIQIVGDYVRAWYQWQLSYLSGQPVGLNEYFTTQALPKATAPVRAMASQGYELHQTDLDHHLRLHTYSADGQLIAFTDHHLTTKQRLYDRDSHQKLDASEDLADYEVVMLLDDGYWRIKHLVRRQPAPLNFPTPTPTDSVAFVRVTGTGFSLGGQPFLPAGVNYYPQKTPWTLFWKQFSPQTTQADFARIRELGLNTVRIFIPFREFGKGTVPPEKIAQLKTLLDLAAAQHLFVIVTLFDFLGDYRLLNLTATDRQLEQLLTAFSRHPALLAWDLKNEPDLDFTHHDRADVEDWLGWMLTRARRYDPNHLLTIGWAYPENAHLLANRVDFVSFHSYKSVAELTQGIEGLRKLVPQKPLVLEEFGQSTYRGVWAPLGNSETEQADYVTAVRQVLAEHGNIPYLIWTLHDFDDVPAEVVGNRPWNRAPQKHFGLLRPDGTAKPVAAAIKP